MSIQTKKALITGASSGIGKATAALMLEQGFEVCGIARSFIAESSSDSKSGSKSQAEASLIDQIGLDLSDLDQLASELNNNQSLNQDFDCLILNAGYGRFGGVEQFSHAQIRQLIDTNLVSNLFLIKHYLPSFKRSGAKDIVLIGSESAITGAKQGAVYCASKFAIRGLAQSLRADCANADVRVILVNPGPVDTCILNRLLVKNMS